MLLHGVGLDRAMWDRCLPALARDHRVDHGSTCAGTARPPPAAPATTLAELAADVVGLLDEVGAAARPPRRLLPRRPRRPALSVDRPQQVSPAPLSAASRHAPPTSGRRFRAAARPPRRPPGHGGSRRVALVRRRPWRHREPELVAIGPPHSAAQRPLVVPGLLHASSPPADAEVGSVARLHHAPTLVITGSDDPGSTPDMTFRLARAIPDARAEIVAGARHLLPVERPDEFVNSLSKHIERTLP